MFEAVKRILAAAEELGRIEDMDIMGFGDGTKAVYIDGTTGEGLPFKLEVKLGIRREETEDAK